MRPLYGHTQQGEQASIECFSEYDNPYPQNDISHVYWNLGYFKECIRSMNYDDPDEVYIHQDKLSEIKYDSIPRFEDEMTLMMPTIAEIENAIKIPANTWEGRCHEIATMMANSGVLSPIEDKYGPLFNAYGIFTGHIDKGNIFSGRPMTRHGWLESPSGFIIDPTRFVFETKKPYIWTGPFDDYDLSGARTRWNNMKNANIDKRDERYVELGGYPQTLLYVLQDITGSNLVLSQKKITISQLSFVMLSPLEYMKEHAVDILNIGFENGLSPIIPTDIKAWYEFTLSQLESQPKPKSHPQF